MDLNRFTIKIIYFFQGIFLKKNYKCPYCSSSDFKVIFKKRGIIDICHCRACSLLWTNPIFEFPRFYDFFYKAEGSTTGIEEQKLPGLINSCFKDSDKNFHQTIKWLKTISPGSKLLEFGSSWGYFLYQAKSYGFDALGIEISEKRAEFGRKKLGVNIATDINKLLKNQEKFDIIFSSHTLEHIGREIRDIFDKFSSLLKEKAVIVIEVPNLDLSNGNEVFKIMGALHPLGFTKDFFIKNFPKYNFRVIESRVNEGNTLIIHAQKTT